MSIPKFHCICNILALSYPTNLIKYDREGNTIIGGFYQVNVKNLLSDIHQIFTNHSLEKIIDFLESFKANESYFKIAVLNNSFYEFDRNILYPYSNVPLKILAGTPMSDHLFRDSGIIGIMAERSGHLNPLPIVLLGLNQFGKVELAVPGTKSKSSTGIAR